VQAGEVLELEVQRDPCEYRFPSETTPSPVPVSVAVKGRLPRCAAFKGVSGECSQGAQWPRWRSRRKAHYRAEMPTDDHALVNRATWDEDAPNWVQRGREAWAREEPVWGRGNAESELHLLPDVAGLDAIELGCGTAYVSAWLMRRGARVVGLDNSSNQLATARMLQEEFGLRFPLVHADAERPPFADASFDFAISQYGAAIWCDPYRWIPEASRILRSGGRLLFETGSPLVMCCFPTDDDDAPADTRLHRDYFGMHRFEWR
jgi:SAM-dependent methyltransferase